MIYLDNAATARPSERAAEKANIYLTEKFFNPSALYGGGFSVHSELEAAREKLLSFLSSPAVHSLIFTSGGTEGDNTAIFSSAKRGNAVATQGEHAAVYESFVELKNRGVEPRFTPLHADGCVDTEALLSLVDEKTTLVSVVHVNNETGAINDISSIAKAVKRKNPRCVFHSDGVQAFGKIPFSLPPEVDLYTVSAHKIGGIKGVGGLFVKNGLPLRPLLYGGGQEEKRRSGTENVFGIMDFCFAAEERFVSLSEDMKRVRKLRELVFSSLEGFRRISPEEGSPYILTVSAEGKRGEVLQRMLWERGVAVGTGSACSSKHRFSRVISACGYKESVLDGVLRVSFSPSTTEEEGLFAAKMMNEVSREYGERV